MISIGGIIGAGLFVGSSSAIATIGPAVVASYALAGLVVLVIMRMLSEMASAVARSRLVHRIHSPRARRLGRLRQRLAVLVFLGGGGRDRSHRRRGAAACNGSTCRCGRSGWR